MTSKGTLSEVFFQSTLEDVKSGLVVDSTGSKLASMTACTMLNFALELAPSNLGKNQPTTTTSSWTRWAKF